MYAPPLVYKCIKVSLYFETLGNCFSGFSFEDFQQQMIIVLMYYFKSTVDIISTLKDL